MTIQTYSDYRDFLRDELSLRLRHNPNYSLRAFARDLKLSSSRLSEVLNRKKGLSRKAAHEVCGRLAFKTNETEYFCDMVDFVHARSKIDREAALERIKDYKPSTSVRTLEIDSFKIVSDWYHLAIFNLMHLKTFKSDIQWISKRLGLSHDLVLEALGRMIRVQMIKLEKGKYVPVQDFVAGPDGIPSEAIRNFHRQVLEKAKTAIDAQSVEKRDLNALVIPMNSKKIELARKRIRDFKLKLSRELTADSELDSVYCLSMQLFDYCPEVKPPQTGEMK